MLHDLFLKGMMEMKLMIAEVVVRMVMMTERMMTRIEMSHSSTYTYTPQ